MAAPDTGVEREPYVPSPYGVLSVSPWITSISAGSNPSSWATICANVVSWPWPWVWTEIASCAEPVGDTRSVAPSFIPRPRMSMCRRGPAPTASVKNDSPIPISSPARAALGLLGAQLVVAGELQHPRERRRVVA